MIAHLLRNNPDSIEWVESNKDSFPSKYIPPELGVWRIVGME